MKVSKVISLNPHLVERSKALAYQFMIPFVDGSELASAKMRHVEVFIRDQVEIILEEPAFVFLLSNKGLSLVQLTKDNFLSIRADFCGSTVRYRRQKGGGKGQMIAKAVGLKSGKPPTILDATAGLGGDAFVLADLGCPMSMTERVLEVRALLEDGLRSAKEWGDVNDVELVKTLNRMTLIHSDAASYMKALQKEACPDVVYLDPMFPLRSKSAQVKKEMHVFHSLIGFDTDADQLLELARDCAKKRVVVKRPRLAPELAASKASYTLEGKSNRFDVYLCG